MFYKNLCSFENNCINSAYHDLFNYIMDLQIVSFPILIASFIFMLIALKIRKKRSKANVSCINLPPGPWKLPLVGNMHNFILSLPHHRLRDLAKQYGPLMHLQLGQISTVVASSPEAAKQIMKTHDVIFAQRPFLIVGDTVAYGSTDIVFSPHGDYWRQLRKICVTDLLSAKSVQSFRSIREEEVSNLIKLISSSAGSTINLSRKIFSMTFGITTRAALGDQKLKDQEEFIATVNEGMLLAGGFSFADVFPSLKFLDTISGVRNKLEKIHQKLDRILERMINEHESSQATRKADECERKKDLLEVLLNLQKHGNLEINLSRDNIKAVILDVFAAGTETSSTTVEWAMSEMIKNPSVMEKAQAEVRDIFSVKGDVDETGLRELKYLKLVIKETLRLHPPVPLLLPRESAKRCEILGYEIPMKTKVIVNAWAIGRDSNYWREAEKFLPERFVDSSIDYKGATFEYIPFGAGRKICPGMEFGIANVELPLAQLLFHFDWKVPIGGKLEDLDMTEGFGLTVRRRNDLYLIPTAFRLVNRIN